jgi:hypothetical protein
MSRCNAVTLMSAEGPWLRYLNDAWQVRMQSSDRPVKGDQDSADLRMTCQLGGAAQGCGGRHNLAVDRHEPLGNSRR